MQGNKGIRFKELIKKASNQIVILDRMSLAIT
jgi:hypothetical protein